LKKYIRKADIILFIVLVVVGLTASIILAMSKSGGDTVVVQRNGELYGKYSLFEDREIVISDTAKAKSSNAKSSNKTENVLVIKDGTAIMESASCHNQVCVHHAAISQTGESIVCLPNKVIVKIEGKDGGYDAISR